MGILSMFRKWRGSLQTGKARKIFAREVSFELGLNQKRF